MLAAAVCSPAFAGKADVIGVKVHRDARGVYNFDVTVKSQDTGWDKYADKWDVVGPNGEIFATRILLHPHVDEQPFTRSLGGISIPAEVKEVTIRAHDKVEGYGGAEMRVMLPQ